MRPEYDGVGYRHGPERGGRSRALHQGIVGPYKLIIAPTAAEQIASHAQFVADQSGAVEVALRWLERVFATIGTLATAPDRFELSEEASAHKTVVRRMLIDRRVVLYCVDEPEMAVYVIGFRHATRLPVSSLLRALGSENLYH